MWTNVYCACPSGQKCPITVLGVRLRSSTNLNLNNHIYDLNCGQKYPIFVLAHKYASPPFRGKGNLFILL